MRLDSRTNFGGLDLSRAASRAAGARVLDLHGFLLACSGDGSVKNLVAIYSSALNASIHDEFHAPFILQNHSS
jgi:hypothetical protein